MISFTNTILKRQLGFLSYCSQPLLKYTFVCIPMHAFILTHTWTHTHAHYYFTLRLLIPFYLCMCLINYFSLVCHPPLRINTPLISVVCCFGVNIWRGRKKNWIDRGQLVAFLDSFLLLTALPTEPFCFLRVFLWCRILQQGFVISLECALHCCSNIVAIMFSNLHFRCLC